MAITGQVQTRDWIFVKNYVGVDATMSIFWVSGYINLGNSDDNAEAIGVFCIVMNAVVQERFFFLFAIVIGWKAMLTFLFSYVQRTF